MKFDPEVAILHSPESKLLADNRIKWLFIGIVSIKILVTMVFLPLIAQAIKHTYDISNNPDFYANIASNLYQDIGYRIFPDTTVTIYREPGYIIVLFSIFSLFGENYFVPRLFNIVFSIIAAFFLWKIGEEVRMPRNAIIIALLLFLIHPAFFFVESRLGVEGLFTMLVVITTYSMCVAQRKQTIFPFILWGLCSATAALTRTTAIPILIAWVVYVLVSNRPNVPIRFKLRNIFAYFLAFLLLFSIWPIRNYILSGKPVITATVGGDSLFQGMYVNKYKSEEKSYYRTLGDSKNQQLHLLRNAGLKPQYSGFHYLYATIEDELQHCNLMKRAVIQEYVNHPKLFFSTLANNSISFWTRGGTTTSTLLNTILVVPILFMTVFGIFLQYRNRQIIFPILLPVLFIYFVQMPILATARHHVPTIPFLMLFSGVFLSWLLQRIKKSTKQI